MSATRTTAVKADAWRAYFETTQLLTAELERRLKADSGMDFGDYNILLVLSEAPEHRLRLGGLARAIAFGPNRLTYRLDVLERRGWVRREPCQDDKRGLEAVLTEDGRRVFRKASLPHSRDVYDVFLDHLTDEQAQALLEVFQPLRDRLTD
jgi:DNA-binding MarR family transcriptional regulator